MSIDIYIYIYICFFGGKVLFPYALHFLKSDTRYYDNILRGLYPLFGESEPDDAVRDNAAGAVARMIMVHPESIPLNQVMSLFIWIMLSQ